MAKQFPKKTDEIGELLQEEYSSEDQDAHIRHFYIKFGKESVKHKPQIIETLKSIMNDSEWVKTESEWDVLILLKELEISPENEREREGFLNETIRKKLKQVQAIPSPVHIILSRACLYTESQIYSKITTGEIGGLMDCMYEPDVKKKSNHIGHFYLLVQAIIGEESFLKKRSGDKDINIHNMAFDELKKLPGDWKSVEPQETWGGTFFGYFPKEFPAMKEREREKLLNGEVRMPLIDKLEHRLAGEIVRGGLKPTVEVIITQACKYTPSPDTD